MKNIIGLATFALSAFGVLSWAQTSPTDITKVKFDPQLGIPVYPSEYLEHVPEFGHPDWRANLLWMPEIRPIESSYQLDSVTGQAYGDVATLVDNVDITPKQAYRKLRELDKVFEHNSYVEYRLAFAAEEIGKRREAKRWSANATRDSKMIVAGRLVDEQSRPLRSKNQFRVWIKLGFQFSKAPVYVSAPINTDADGFYGIPAPSAFTLLDFRVEADNPARGKVETRTRRLPQLAPDSILSEETVTLMPQSYLLPVESKMTTSEGK